MQERIQSSTFLYTGSSALKKIISIMFQPEKETSKQLITAQYPMSEMIPDFFTKQIQYFVLSSTEEVNTEKENTPSNSFIRFYIPLKTNHHARLPFERLSTKQMRIGRILQLMDSLAGLATVRFTNKTITAPQKSLFTIVTACCDNIYVDDSMTCEEDLIVQSHVNFVGSTSAEIEVNLLQSGDVKASAFFTMVTRDSSHIGKGGKGYPMPTLVFTGQSESQKCKQREERGKANRNARLERSKKSLETTTPTTQQIAVLHQFFMKKTQPSSSVAISSTATFKSLLMQSQYRNINNKIFGGFLMRQMLETAWFAAQKFAHQSNLKIQRIEDIFFIEPVQIGEGIEIVSKAVYSHHNFLVVKTQAFKIRFKQGMRLKACQMYATFSDQDEKDMTEVFPESYSEGIEYLMGRRVLRRIEGCLSNGSEKSEKC